MKARWEQEYDDQIDGVVALDPVALSYLLEGLGKIVVGGVDLTSENVVDELLCRPPTHACRTPPTRTCSSERSRRRSSTV